MEVGERVVSTSNHASLHQRLVLLDLLPKRFVFSLQLLELPVLGAELSIELVVVLLLVHHVRGSTLRYGGILHGCDPFMNRAQPIYTEMVVGERAPSTVTSFEIDRIDLAQGFWECLVFHFCLNAATHRCHT